MNIPFEEKLKKIPEAPKAFGEDGGYFYKYYDMIADELDDDMVKSLKSQLDGILIYAGLFAGVNSAFLALTLPEMSADPADDTNALLLQLVTGGERNVTSADDLPSASFSPPSGIFPINILFSLSLTLALLAAFLAVIGQQWLVYYRKRSGGGAEAQRREQFQRYRGAKRWRLEAILDDILPSLLQLGLVTFCIGLALYLGTLSPWMCYTVAIPMGLALACILAMAISAALDQWCPFKSPLSHALQAIASPVARLVWGLMLKEGPKAKKTIGRATRRMTEWTGKAVSRPRSWSLGAPPRAERPAGTATEPDTHPVRVTNDSPRTAELSDPFRVLAARRVLFTSEDTNALIYTAVNLQALESAESERLLNYIDVHDRLMKEVGHAFPAASGVEREPSNPQALQARALCFAFMSLVLSSGSTGFLLGPGQELIPPPSPSTNDIQALRDVVSKISGRAQVPNPIYSDTDINPSTMRLCLILIDMILNPPVNSYDCFRWWFEDHARLYKESRDSFTDAPFPPYLLARAIQAYIKIVPLALKKDIASLSEDKEYLDWSLQTVCNIVRMYRSCNALAALELIKEVSSSKAFCQPADSVYIWLLWQGIKLCRSQDSDFKTVFITATVDLCRRSIEFRVKFGPSGLPDYTIEQSTNLVRCMDILKTVWTPTQFSGIPVSDPREGFEEKIEEFLQVIFSGAKARIDIFDRTVYERVLGLESCLTEGPTRGIEERLRIYRKIECELMGMGISKYLKRPSLQEAKPVTDPPGTQAVGGYPGHALSVYIQNGYVVSQPTYLQSPNTQYGQSPPIRPQPGVPQSQHLQSQSADAQPTVQDGPPQPGSSQLRALQTTQCGPSQAISSQPGPSQAPNTEPERHQVVDPQTQLSHPSSSQPDNPNPSTSSPEPVNRSTPQSGSSQPAQPQSEQPQSSDHPGDP